MKIEGDRLIFSTGKSVQSQMGLVALDRDGYVASLSHGKLQDLSQTNLTDEERWELAKYMMGRWEALAKKIWDVHEAAMYQAPMETREEDSILYDLAKEYHDRCEAFDRQVCTGNLGRGGGIMPANDEETRQIGTNAILIVSLIKKKGLERGISEEAVMEAIQSYGRNR